MSSSFSRFRFVFVFLFFFVFFFGWRVACSLIYINMARSCINIKILSSNRFFLTIQFWLPNLNDLLIELINFNKSNELTIFKVDHFFYMIKKVIFIQHVK